MPCIGLICFIQTLPDTYRGLAPDLCTLVVAHTLVQGTPSFLLGSLDQDKGWFSLSSMVSPRVVLS